MFYINANAMPTKRNNQRLLEVFHANELAVAPVDVPEGPD